MLQLVELFSFFGSRNKMAGFDDVGVFFSDNFGADNNQDLDNDHELNRATINKKFKMFIREFHVNNLFIYR
mgnify:FL=1